MAGCLALAVTGGLVACESSADDGKVHISVGSLPPKTEPGARKAFLNKVAAFEEANPDIEVEADEYLWEAATFTARLAGGTLPTVFEIPFTDSQGLIDRQQLADITTQVDDLPYADEFNPDVLAVAQDDDGNIYGVPSEAYAVGMHYNRALFEEAGLDPDKPPTTWEEVRGYADTIAEETGRAGFAQMGQDNTGGWMLTTLTYSMGGRMESVDSDGNVSVTLDNPQTLEALQLLHDMRWEDGSMGEDVLFNYDTINQAFAAGSIGMYMSGSDVYAGLVTENNIDPATYGLATIPVLDDPEAGVLGGGTVRAVSASATEAEKEAAVKWIDFYYMDKLTDKTAAVEDAVALSESGVPVGTPALPIFNAAQLERYDSWVQDHVNVPIDQMAPFKSHILSQELIPEPPVQAQELYAALDPIVQAVLTEESVDVEALLDRANDEIEALIDQGS